MSIQMSSPLTSFLLYGRIGLMIIVERGLTPLVLNPPSNITKVKDTETEVKLFDFLEKTKDFGFDVETNPIKDFYWRRMRTMQFGTAQEQYVIDLRDYCDGNSDTLFSCQGNFGEKLKLLAPRLHELIQNLTKYLCSNTWVKTGVNLGFEYMCMYWLFGVRIFGLYDCMLAEKCIYAGLGGHASLKNYEFYSLESMFERYFGMTIDKSLQMSFNLEDDISQEQDEYAALDTRIPLAIKLLQTVIASGETPKSLKTKGKPKIAEYLQYLDSIILGDNLHEIIGIENEAVCGFIDMHVHGERLDRPRWLARVQKSKDRLIANLQSLDKIFLPIVGSKNEAIDDKEIELRESEWKALGATRTDEEIKWTMEARVLKRQLKKEPMNMDLSLQIAELEIKTDQWEQARKAQKDVLKGICNEMKKKRTKINNLKEKCEGEALINYGSDAQLRDVLQDPANAHIFPQLFHNERIEGKVTGNKISNIEALDDDVLEKYNHVPVMKLIQEYHGLSKEIGTYGDAWATEWTTHPCKEEGWLHPGDKRLHSTFNQLDAATGRSSSSQPNGQNLPQDPEVRGCFIADPPDENVRISDCCESECQHIPGINTKYTYRCFECAEWCNTHAEEYVIVTADMSGAELRIIAEDADDLVWINAFARKEDVHSVGTELLYEIEWLQEALENCAYFKLHTEETVSKSPLCTIGEAQRQKCKCPLHKIRRDDNKSTNFLLAYGGGPTKLATEIKKTVKEAKALMALHEQKNPKIWAYLEKSGRDAAMNFKAFDLFGRRRLLPEPTRPRAVENCKEYNEEKLRIPKEESDKTIETFVTVKGRKPNKIEEFELTHRQPTANEVSNSFFQMSSSITRQGKNHRIQGTNATIAKKAMGAGYCPDGKPFLFHTLPLYKARLIKFVHDELVVQCPKRFGKKVAELIGDAFKRAAAIKMKKVIMEFDYNIATYWKK